jgi:hypothetical protein
VVRVLQQPNKKATLGAWPVFEPKGQDTQTLAPANFRCWKHSRQKTGRP